MCMYVHSVEVSRLAGVYDTYPLQDLIQAARKFVVLHCLHAQHLHWDIGSQEAMCLGCYYAFGKKCPLIRGNADDMV